MIRHTVVIIWSGKDDDDGRMGRWMDGGRGSVTPAADVGQSEHAASCV